MQRPVGPSTGGILGLGLGGSPSFFGGATGELSGFPCFPPSASHDLHWR